MKKPILLFVLLALAWLPGHLLAQTATHTWNFNGALSDGAIDGWNLTNYDLATSSASNGILKLYGTKTNNFIQHSPAGSIDPTVSKVVTIRMKNETNQTKARFYWWATDPAVAAAFIEFSVSANDTEFKEYYLDLSEDTRWGGTITSIRFDLPAALPATEYAMPISVDKIRFFTEADVPENPNARYTYIWQFDDPVSAGKASNWTITNYVNASTSNGILSLTGDKTNNFIKYDFLSNAYLNANQTKTAVIRLKNETPETKARFYFWSADVSKPAYFIEFNISANDTEFKEYVIDLTAKPEWAGDIKIIRFDIPASFQAASIGTSIKIDYIKLRNTLANAVSSNAYLGDLTVSEGTLEPEFAAFLTSYSTSVPSTTTSIDVAPTVMDGKATVTVNGNSVVSGSAVSVALNEGSNTIPIVVTAEDGTTKTYSLAVTRAAANQTPTDIALSVTSANENVAVGTTVATFTTTDADASDTHTYSLVSGDGDSDNASFTIDGNALQTATTLDYEAKNSYSILVKTTDSQGATFNKTFTITVSNVNEAPTAVALSSSVIAENEAAGTTVGTLSSTDPDAADTHSYALVSGEDDADNSSFIIDGNALKAVGGLNFEDKASYSVRVQTLDAGGLSFSRTFTITVSDVNEAPTDLQLSNTNLAENNTVGALVGILSSTDTDANDTQTYALVSGEGDTDNAMFTVDGNELKAGAAFDFETKNSYSIRVQTTDNGSLTFSRTFTVSVSNENEAPTAVALSQSDIDENNSAGATVGTLSATDPDAAETFTYSLVTGDGDADNASFTIDGNALKVSSALDFETKNSYTVRVQAQDAGGLAFSRSFSITVNNMNEAPTAVALSNGEVAEGNTVGEVIGTFTSSDPDAGATFSYALVSGEGDTDNASFTVDGNSLKAAEVFNFETKSSYLVRVQTTDADGLTFSRSFTILVNNINEAPTAIALSNMELAEGNAVGDLVGTFTTTDPDAADTHTYALVTGEGDTDNASFTIEGNSLKAAEAFDFETKTSYNLRVQATDIAGLTFARTFTVNVTNVTEAGIKEDVAASEKYTLYPNPTTHTLNLNSPVFDGGEVSVLDVAGREVHRGKVSQKQIDVASLAAGSYILVVVKGNERLYKRFLKQ